MDVLRALLNETLDEINVQIAALHEKHEKEVAGLRNTIDSLSIELAQVTAARDNALLQLERHKSKAAAAMCQELREARPPTIPVEEEKD